jgi:hypothetical protein
VALTDLLNNGRPAWREWFEEHFPAVEPLQHAFRERILAMPDRHEQPRRASPLTLSMSGTGFEHRVRYLLDNEPPLDLAMRGSTALAGGAGLPDDERRLREVFERFLDEHRARVGHIRPANRTLDESDERTLAADCVVLGLLEQPVRQGDSRAPELTRHLAGLHGPDDLLAVVPPAVIDDMVALSTVGLARLGPLRDAATTVAVAGSPHLDGANADMVIGDLLLELRTTTRPSLHREWLYQLLGSVLLDFADLFEIRTAGFYLTRQDALVTWPVAELISTAAGNPDLSVDHARQQFQAFLTAGTAADPEAPAVPCG